MQRRLPPDPSSTRAASAGVLAIGPASSSDQASGKTSSRLTAAVRGLEADNAHRRNGTRMDPAVSVPQRSARPGRHGHRRAPLSRRELVKDQQVARCPSLGLISMSPRRTRALVYADPVRAAAGPLQRLPRTSSGTCSRTWRTHLRYRRRQRCRPGPSPRKATRAALDSGAAAGEAPLHLIAWRAPLDASAGGAAEHLIRAAEFSATVSHQSPRPREHPRTVAHDSSHVRSCRGELTQTGGLSRRIAFPMRRTHRCLVFAPTRGSPPKPLGDIAARSGRRSEGHIGPPTRHPRRTRAEQGSQVTRAARKRPETDGTPALGLATSRTQACAAPAGRLSSSSSSAPSARGCSVA